MNYYIAVRNPLTGLFEVQAHNHYGKLEPTKYENENSALIRFENEVNIHGTDNVLMYELVPITIKIKANIIQKN